MAAFLLEIGETLPVIAAGVSLVGGLIALFLVNRGVLRQRRDRGAAASAAVGLGLISGGIAAVITAMIGAGGGGGNVLSALPTAVFVFGLPVALTVGGASTLGYVGLARWRPGSNAASGAVLGPILLGAACLGAVVAIQTAKDMLAAESLQQEREEVAANSTALHLAVDDVVTTLDGEGLVSAVRVRLTIRSDTDLALEVLPDKWVYPLFTLSPNGDDPNTQILAQAPPGSPDVLAAGSTTTYDVLFDSATTGTPTLSRPGDWLLAVQIGGRDGQVYGLEATISVPAG